MRIAPSPLAATLLAAGLLAGAGAQAADKVKVGFVSTLTGPSAALGVDIRDAFMLAVKLNGGKLGGLPAEVLVTSEVLASAASRARLRTVARFCYDPRLPAGLRFDPYADGCVELRAYRFLP